MSKQRQLLNLGLAFAALSAGAVAHAQVGTPLTPAQLAAAVTKMTPALLKYGKTILHQVKPGKSIHTYNWGLRQTAFASRPDVANPVVTGDYRVIQYIDYLRTTTFKTGQGAGMAGPGPYFAPDPVTTFASYGGGQLTQDSFMVQMVLDAGTYFLDGLNDPGFDPDLASQAQAAGCLVANVTSLFEFVSFEPACLPIRDALIAVTHAAALRYAFTAATPMQFTGCPNQSRPAQAFVMFGDTDKKWKSMLDGAVVFGPDLPTLQNNPHLDNGRLIEHLFSIASQLFLKAPWAAFNGQSSHDPMPTWMLDNMASCEEGRAEGSVN